MNRTAEDHALLTISAFGILPPLLYVIWYIAREKRKAAALQAASPPFSPQDPADSSLLLNFCGFFFRHFDAPQRVDLRSQRRVPAFGLALTWLYFVLFSSGLLPQFVADYADQQPLPLRVWYSYLFHISFGFTTYAILALILIVTAVGELVPASSIGRFIRTRPLSRGFIFWTRVVSAFSALIASFAIAATASFLLLLLMYGPVWKHLDDGAQPAAAAIAHARSQPAPTADDILESRRSGAGHFEWALQTSVPRLFLSIVTTQSLIFSLAIFVAMLPIRSLLKFGALYALFGLYIVYVVVGSGISPNLARLCFLYVRPGPPPHWIFALVPILISVALLGLADRFNNRNDG